MGTSSMKQVNKVQKTRIRKGRRERGRERRRKIIKTDKRVESEGIYKKLKIISKDTHTQKNNKIK